MAVVFSAAAGVGMACFSVASRMLLQRNVAPRVLARVLRTKGVLLLRGGTTLGSAAVPLLMAVRRVRTAIAVGCAAVVAPATSGRKPHGPGADGSKSAPTRGTHVKRRGRALGG